MRPAPWLALLALCGAGAVAQPCVAQGPCTSYRACALRVHVRFTGPLVVAGQDGHVVSKPGFGGPIVPALSLSSDSSGWYYGAYRRAGRQGALIGMVGGVAGVASIFYVGNYAQHKTAFYSLLSVGVVTAIWSGIENAKAMSNLQQSIWHYNARFTGAP